MRCILERTKSPNAVPGLEGRPSKSHLVFSAVLSSLAGGRSLPSPLRFTLQRIDASPLNQGEIIQPQRTHTEICIDKEKVCVCL